MAGIVKVCVGRAGDLDDDVRRCPVALGRRSEGEDCRRRGDLGRRSSRRPFTQHAVADEVGESCRGRTLPAHWTVHG